MSTPHTTRAERRATVWAADVDDSDVELVHVVCCVDEDTALCSTDVSAEPWTRSEISCVVCGDLETTKVCPRFGHCVPLPRRMWAALTRRRR
jgi:hypothetical protein